MELNSLSIKEYINAVSNKTSVPGGGSVLALTNELAAALLLMVCNFTISKKGYENVHDRIERLIKEISLIKDNCHELINEDAISFNNLMLAFKSKNEDNISIAAIDAALTPYKLLKISKSLLKFADEIKLIGNSNLISDAEIAYELIKSSIPGTLHHIQINLKSIKDEKIKFLLEKEIGETNV